MLDESQLDLPVALPVKGLLSVEHCGIPAKEHDGICLTSVTVLPPELHTRFDTFTDPDYSWHSVSDSNIQADLMRKLSSDDSLIALVD